MDREIVLLSYSVKTEANNRPEDFTTNFTEAIVLNPNEQYAIGLNRIINMSFTWFNINAKYRNQLIRYSSDGEKNFSRYYFSRWCLGL